jgi:hypothetical protein
MQQDLRTKKTFEKYKKARAEGILNHGCRLCQIKPIKEFKHWIIIDNEYPWDLIAKTNHMIVPKRHVTYNKLNQAEKKEFDLIKATYVEKYELIVEATHRQKSIPDHFHVHLIILKDSLHKK